MVIFFPTITTPVDNTSLTFKVFLMNNWLWQSHFSCDISVYESSTGAWRGCQIHEGHGTKHFTGVFEASSVFFQGTIFWHSESQAVLVFSYNVGENSWKEVLQNLTLILDILNWLSMVTICS
jgi:hypothetical protein